MRIGAIILAAGSASRMGSAKQLLPFRGRTLVEHAIVQAEEAEFQPIVLVVGARAEEIRNAVQQTSAVIVFNVSWQSGMGSSISRGASTVLEIAPDLDAIAVLLADQPLITGFQLKEMRREFGQDQASEDPTPRIIAAYYSGTLGVPAIFGKNLFSQLSQLPAQYGARSLLRGGEACVRPYHLPEAATDIDTPEDFAAIQ